MKRYVKFRIPVLLAAIMALAVTCTASEEPNGSDETRDIGLVEETSSHLAQIDVTVSGPADIVRDLGREDFELRVRADFIEEFIVDRVCRRVGSTERKEPEPGLEIEAPSMEPPEERRSPVTFIFFFDQPHLTMAGRINALDIARQLVRDLISDEAQAMIISSAGDLEVMAEMTSDPDVLLSAIDSLENHKKQWHSYSELEDSRIAEVINALRDDVEIALAVARRHQAEETWQAERSLNRISMIMGRMVELDPPKAFFYFADSMRSNPGEHYLSYFGNILLQEKYDGAGSNAGTLQTRALMAGNSFDRILNDASALGVRFYTVQAEGLVAPDVMSRRPGSSTGGMTSSSGLQSARPANQVRYRDAQDTLAGMALETGGRAFLNGVPTKKIVKRVVEDLSCVYLISFDPVELPEDEPLPVRVTVTRPKVRVQARGRLVVQSDEERQTSRLLAAYATSAGDDSSQPIEGVVVPTGYDGKEYSALVQITVPGTKVANATWDMGASLVARGKVREDASGRIRTATPGVKVIFEREMTFPPGEFELVTVVHETTTDQIFQKKIDGEFPDPDDAPATIGPITILQPERGAFFRNGEVKKSGALAMSGSNPVVTDRPTVLLGLICRNKANKRPLLVKRNITGEDSVPFTPVEMEPSEDRCVQIRDLVPARMMSDGSFRYEISVLEKDVEIASAGKQFEAVLSPR